MLKNKQTLAQMNQKLKKTNLKNAELEKTIMQLTTQVEERNAEIIELKDELAKNYLDITNLNFEIGELNKNNELLANKNNEQIELIDKQTIELNTAYYIIGTKRELKENNVISKKGGFLGIGQKGKLMENFNKDYFTKIDITKEKEILVFSKAKIITNHPSESYYTTGEKQIDSLIIKSPNEFWSVSKFLVIIVD